MGYFDKFKNEGVPFMEGREKGNIHEIVDEPLHIMEFGFIHGNNGDFAVIRVAEVEDKFYFCNSIITELLQTVRDDGMESELAEQVVYFEERKSKNGQTYMTYRFE